MEGLNLGALDYIHKPFVSSILLRRLELHLSLVDYQKILEGENRSKDMLLSRIIQEIRGPITTIKEMVNRVLNEPVDIKDYLGKVNDTAQQLLEIVDNTTFS